MLASLVRTLTVLSFMVGLATVWSGTHASGQATGTVKRQPNIIYIMVDDLGYGDLGCFGQEQIATPHLDQMAKEGMRFTDYYAGHTVCRPSRLTLWTGQHVGSTGLIGNRQFAISSDHTTVASLLKDAGYKTGGVGKWSLGTVNDPKEIDNPGHPNKHGFDYWFGFMNQGLAHNHFPPYLWENMTQVTLQGNVLSDHPGARGRVSKERVTFAHDAITDAAFRFVEQNVANPFLLHIHWTIPHANNEGSRVYQNGMEVKELGEYANRDWPEPEKGFAAMVAKMDQDVGRLLELLRELKLDKDTLVIFTSDNGPHNEGNHKQDFFKSAGPLRGYKRSMHEGGIRVPMIAWWPGVVAAGTESDLPSAGYDFLPTACEIAAVESPKDIDGISYLPTLLGQNDQQEMHPYLFWASSEGATSIGARFGDWKLVKFRHPGKGPAWGLYHLKTDIGEAQNLAAEQPQRLEGLLTQLRRDGLIE